ncbi:unnamed protein product, partial [Amoebophrya sp. A25]
ANLNQTPTRLTLDLYKMIKSSQLAYSYLYIYEVEVPHLIDFFFCFLIGGLSYIYLLILSFHERQEFLQSRLYTFGCWDHHVSPQKDPYAIFLWVLFIHLVLSNEFSMISLSYLVKCFVNVLVLDPSRFNKCA